MQGWIAANPARPIVRIFTDTISGIAPQSAAPPSSPNFGAPGGPKPFALKAPTSEAQRAYGSDLAVGVYLTDGSLT